MDPDAGRGFAGPYVKALQLLNANISKTVGSILNLKSPKRCKFNGLQFKKKKFKKYPGVADILIN
jgi:hypothetical protein